MKVLITGATGFIGSRLALRSIQQGHSVVALGQTNTDAERSNLQVLEQAGVRVVLGSVADEDKIAIAIEGCDIVFHLAAAQHEANVPDQHFWDVNVSGTENMLNAALKAGVKRFMHGSTIGVYGSAAEGEISEDAPARPDNIYGRTKLEAEQRVLGYADRLPLTIVRISETYGPGDRRLLKLFKAIDKRVFFMIGSGGNKHQLIYVDDLIDGMYLLAHEANALGKIMVLVGSEVLTTRDMVEKIAESLGVKLRRFRAPLWPFMAAAYVLEKALRPLGIQPPLHRRRMDFFRKSFFFSPGRAVTLFGFKPRMSFSAGAAETAKWYRENGYL